MMLVAELAIPEPASRTFVLALVGLILLFAVFFFWLVFRQAARFRQFAHLERMKALELGRAADADRNEDPPASATSSCFWIAFWLGAGVPFAATSAASSIMINTHLEEFRVILALWICVAVLSISALICATTVMICGASTERTREEGTGTRDAGTGQPPA